MSSFSRRLEEETRLRVLQILADRDDLRLNSILIGKQLSDQWGVNESREWLHQQLRYLANLGALTIIDVKDIRIAELTETGRAFLEREIVLEGVRKPARDEG